MCGRYVSPDAAAMERAWHVGGRSKIDISWLVPLVEHFNAAPTQLLPVLRHHPERGLIVEAIRWGLIPSWARDAGIGAKMINARGETVGEKPAFRAAFKRRRCLVPMRGFYEWKRTASGKLPHFIHLLDAEVFGVAGLWEYWPGKEGAEPVTSYTIITTSANEMVARLHDRMPVILNERDQAAWLDPGNEDAAALQSLLKPYPSEEMRAYPVSKRVNSPKNDDAALIEPETDDKSKGGRPKDEG